MPGKDNSDKEAKEVFSQRKRPESGRYLLQVDKQTKGSYKTPRRLSHGRFAPQSRHPPPHSRSTASEAWRAYCTIQRRQRVAQIALLDSVIVEPRSSPSNV